MASLASHLRAELSVTKANFWKIQNSNFVENESHDISFEISHDQVNTVAGGGANTVPVLVPAAIPTPATSSTFFHQRFPSSAIEVTSRRVVDTLGNYLQARLPALVDRLVFYEREED